MKTPTIAINDKEICFPYAKINLGLFVTKRLPNGYHILQTLFYPIDWRDALEVIPTSQIGECRLVQTGIAIGGNAEQNLVVKAYRRLQAHFPELPGIEVHLEKQIPFGAGLGGGSSDGAHALLMIRKLFNLPIDDATLAREAAAMGADCTFFLHQGAQYCEGIGYELEPHPLSLKGHYIVVVKPPFGVSTAEAYANVKPQEPAVPLEQLLKCPLDTWRMHIVNDFEASVFPHHPQLQEAKDELYRRGAIYASMSGSGSALFGIFDTSQENLHTWFDNDWQVQGHWAMI